MSKLEQFDRAIQDQVNAERRTVYGHPLDHFTLAATLKAPLQQCQHLSARHGLEMIADKMARLCTSPDHLDSWLDIAGYARAVVMALDLEAAIKAQATEQAYPKDLGDEGIVDRD